MTTTHGRSRLLVFPLDPTWSLIPSGIPIPDEDYSWSLMLASVRVPDEEHTWSLPVCVPAPSEDRTWLFTLVGVPIYFSFLF